MLELEWCLSGKRAAPCFHMHRQLAQKTLNFISPHILGVALAVEQNKPARPVEVGFLSADTVVAHAESLRASDQAD